jgi:hypothetical protein
MACAADGRLLDVDASLAGPNQQGSECPFAHNTSGLSSIWDVSRVEDRPSGYTKRHAPVLGSPDSFARLRQEIVIGRIRYEGELHGRG